MAERVLFCPVCKAGLVNHYTASYCPNRHPGSYPLLTRYDKIDQRHANYPKARKVFESIPWWTIDGLPGLWGITRKSTIPTDHDTVTALNGSWTSNFKRLVGIEDVLMRVIEGRPLEDSPRKDDVL